MNCYNHPIQVAVAQCLDCGKGLCSQCASIYSIPICNSCNRLRISSERKRIVKELLVTFIGGGILTYLLLSILVREGITASWGTLIYIMLFYICTGVIAGWKTLTNITPRVFLVLPIIGWVIYFGLKLGLSLWLGLIMLPIRTVRNIMRLVKLQKIV